MKTKNNNTETLKSLIKAEYFEQIELVEYGIQAYGIDSESEYNVVIMAEKTKGRYYFTTREGYRVAWSTICTTLADAVGIAANSTLPSYDIRIDAENFAEWQNIAAHGVEYIDPRAPFFVYIRTTGTESGTREHCRERCAVLGAPVYVVKIERGTTVEGYSLAGRYTMEVRTAEPTGTDDDQTTTEATTEATESAENTTPTDSPATTGEAVSEAESMKKAGRALLTIARRAAGVLLLLVGCCSCFAAFVALLNVVAPYVPDLLPVRLLLVIPAAAVAFGLAFLYIKTFGSLNHCAHLLDNGGDNCPRW